MFIDGVDQLTRTQNKATDESCEEKSFELQRLCGEYDYIYLCIHFYRFVSIEFERHMLALRALSLYRAQKKGKRKSQSKTRQTRKEVTRNCLASPQFNYIYLFVRLSRFRFRYLDRRLRVFSSSSLFFVVTTANFLI